MSKGLGSLPDAWGCVSGPCLVLHAHWECGRDGFGCLPVEKVPAEESLTCWVCCVGWGARRLSPCWWSLGRMAPSVQLHGALWGAGLEPSPRGTTSGFLVVGIPAAGLFSGFFFLMFTPLMTTIALQVFLPHLLD